MSFVAKYYLCVCFQSKGQATVSHLSINQIFILTDKFAVKNMIFFLNIRYKKWYPEIMYTFAIVSHLVNVYIISGYHFSF